MRFILRNVITIAICLSVAESDEVSINFVEFPLFDLRTGGMYSRDDIFKPGEANQIRKFLITQIDNQIGIDVNEDSVLTADDVWTKDSAFAVFEHGILFYFVDFHNAYGIDEPGFLISYSTMLPYLRTGTPVWNLANGK